MKLVATCCCSLKDGGKNCHEARSNGELGSWSPLLVLHQQAVLGDLGCPPRARMGAGDQETVRIWILTGWRLQCVHQVGPELESKKAGDSVLKQEDGWAGRKERMCLTAWARLEGWNVRIWDNGKIWPPKNSTTSVLGVCFSTIYLMSSRFNHQLYACDPQTSVSSSDTICQSQTHICIAFWVWILDSPRDA